MTYIQLYNSPLGIIYIKSDGKVATYNDIAKKIAEYRGIKKMSAQAVGGAVG